MPLRSAPLPRMAGHLSFMRAQTKAICDVRPGDLAVLGLPFEDTSAPYAGQSLAPRALRETSVYFGWHANPQFSHPVDIDARQDIQTDGLHERFVRPWRYIAGPDDAVHAALKSATSQINRNGACAIILGGSDRLSETVQSALPNCQTAQLGGTPSDARDFHIAPLPNGSGTTFRSEQPHSLQGCPNGEMHLSRCLCGLICLYLKHRSAPFVTNPGWVAAILIQWCNGSALWGSTRLTPSC